MMQLRMFLTIAILSVTSIAKADLIVTVGDHNLVENGTTTFDVLVTGGDPVQGLNVFFQLGDGGTIAGGDDNIPAPSIVSIDAISGTIFDGNNQGQNDDANNTARLFVSSIVTVNGTAMGTGKLFSVTVDANNATAGSQFDLLLRNANLGATTDFAGIPATSLGSGMLTISAVPEPSALGLVGLVGCISAFRRRRTMQ